MKIREGFVSNSSSSSFIIGYAIIKDKRKLEVYCKEHEINLIDSVDALADVRVVPCIYVDKEHRILSCTNHEEVIIPSEMTYENGEMLLVELGNDEGDYAFWDEERENMEWERAKSLSFWYGWQKALIELFERADILDVRKSEIRYGAERNG